MTDPYMERPGMAATRDRAVYYDVDATSVVTPTDRVRWASIIAGIFTVMASLIFFTVLGIAVGFSAWEPGNAYDFGLGTGIYSIVVGLISFFLGGLIAARTAAVAGHDNGLLNGAMVWVATIVLIVNFLGAGLGTLLGVGGDALSTAANTTTGAIATVGEDLGIGAPGEDAVNAPVTVTNQELESTADSIGDAAWWALLAMGLTAAAAILGGLAGARPAWYRRAEIAE